MQLPAKFNVESRAGPGIGAVWESQAETLDSVCCSIPKEFNGPGGGYSPEDLFALSVINCMIATFKVYAEKSNISFQSIEAKAELIVDRHPSENFLSMTQIKIKFDIQGASDKDRLKTILDKAIKDCAVSNSIKTGKTFEINIS